MFDRKTHWIEFLELSLVHIDIEFHELPPWISSQLLLSSLYKFLEPAEQKLDPLYMATCVAHWCVQPYINTNRPKPWYFYLVISRVEGNS